MAYTVGSKYDRTPEEYRDPFLAWKRDDKAFFAAGACHILAHMFLQLHNGEGYELIHIKPKQHNRGHHMYASNGTWAFDFNGWTHETELLAVYTAAYRGKYDDWDYDRIVVTEGLPSYALKADHCPPEYFPYLPWERAYSYIKQFPSKPPTN